MFYLGEQMEEPPPTPLETDGTSVYTEFSPAARVEKLLRGFVMFGTAVLFAGIMK